MEFMSAALLAIDYGFFDIRADPVVAFLAGVGGGAAYQDAIHERSANAFAGVVRLDVELDNSSKAG